MGEKKRNGNIVKLLFCFRVAFNKKKIKKKKNEILLDNKVFLLKFYWPG